MVTSSLGKSLLIKSEGYRKRVYLDSVGKPTIGVGHLLTYIERRTGIITIQGKPHETKKGLSYEQALFLMSQDLYRFEKSVNDLKLDFTQYQFDALVHFCFNIGVPAFKKSTLVKRLKSGNWGDVPRQIRRWVKQKELKSRREKEVRMWLGRYSHIKTPEIKRIPVPPAIQAIKKKTPSYALNESEMRAARLILGMS